MIEQQHRQHTRQRLREENSPGREAKHFDAGDLEPEAQRRLINRYEAARIERDKEEVMQTIGHALHASRIIEIAEPVLSQLIKVHKDRDEHYANQAQPRPVARPELVWPG